MRISRHVKKNSNCSIPCCIQFLNTLGTQVPNTRSIKTTTINIIQFQNNIRTVKINFLVNIFEMKIARFLLQSMIMELALCRTFPKCFNSLTNGKGNLFNKIGVILL